MEQVEREQVESRIRKEWLEQRRRGIGGSDVAAVLGISPYETPFDVWLDKRGEAPARNANEAMWWGTHMEELIARRYFEVTGVALVNPLRTFEHPKYPFLLASPDRLALVGELGLECKTASTYLAHEWGEPGTDEIPRYYLTQVLHYMTVLGVPRWDVAVLIGGNDFRIYTVRSNPAVQEALTERLVAWWQRHMVENEMPMVDASSNVDGWVQTKYPRQNANRVASTSAVDESVATLGLVRSQRAALEEHEELLKNKLKVFIGEASGIDGPDYRVTWNKVSDRKEVDWQAAFNDLCAGEPKVSDDEREAIIERWSRVLPGRRRFLLTPKRGKEGA